MRLILIFKCIIGFQSQSIDFINAFSQAYIPSREPVLIEIPRGFNSYGGQCDVFLRLKKILYGQDEATCLWYECFWKGLLDRGFVASKVDPCLFMYKTVICMVYVDACIFWEHSQSDIDNVTKSFKEDGSSCYLSRICFVNWVWQESDLFNLFLSNKVSNSKKWVSN